MGTDYCKKELKQIAQRNAKPIEEGWVPRQACASCVFHRFVRTEDYDADTGRVLPPAIVDSRMSVIVECAQCDFGEVDITVAYEQAKAEGLIIVGCIRLSANHFLGRWAIMHDPHDYLSRGEYHPQHPNHTQVICEKTIDLYDELKPNLNDWSVGPE
jgi:hypothetical protein